MSRTYIKEVWVAIILLVSADTTAQSRSEQTVDVSDIAWTIAIENFVPLEKLSGSASSRRDLIFWVKLTGTSSALRFIKETSELPVQIKFLKNSALGMVPERIFYLESNMINSSTEFNEKVPRTELNYKEIRQKEIELKEKGFFTFFVWARLTPERLKGSHKITSEIVLKDNSKLKCSDGNCDFSIRVE